MRLTHWQTVLLFWLTPFWFRLLFATSPATTSLPTCTPQKSIPMHLPIRNVTLSDGTLRRGAAVSFGTPGQPFAFRLDPNYNGTYLNDVTGPACNVNTTGLQCSTQYGGLFNPGISTTWSPADSHAWSTGPGEEFEQQDDIWGSDTLLVNTTLSVPGFPLGIFRSNGSQNSLGLGRNSSLLNALSSAGAISSRTFSIFQGWTGAQTAYQTDGSLILGGYDSAKITGNNITLPFTVNDSCRSGLLISVTDINMNLNNGSNISIIGQSRGSALTACIDPSFSPISLPDEVRFTFTEVTGVPEIGRSFSQINLWGMILPANSAYGGSLTFSIYPDLEIAIPNHQLVVPNIIINSEGQEYLDNYSTEVEVLINSLQGVNTNYMPLFGLPFLSSAYLIVDNDKQQFTLSQSQQSATSNLIAIGLPPCNTPVPSPTPQSLPSVHASPTSIATPKLISSTPTGAIAGSVVGGLAIIAICMGLFFIRKRRQAKYLRTNQEQEAVSIPAVNSSVYTKPELAADRQPPQELAADSQPPQEMPVNRDSERSTSPYEMPGTPRLRVPGSTL